MFPVAPMLDATRSGDNWSRPATDSMILALAWWGTNRLMSDGPTPERSIERRADSTVTLTAFRKTSWPFMVIPEPCSA